MGTSLYVTGLSGSFASEIVREREKNLATLQNPCNLAKPLQPPHALSCVNTMVSTVRLMIGYYLRPSGLDQLASQRDKCLQIGNDRGGVSE